MNGRSWAPAAGVLLTFGLAHLAAAGQGEGAEALHEVLATLTTPGAPGLRAADRQRSGKLLQLPPRRTRTELESGPFGSMSFAFA